jgi:hypothetical protein
MGKTLPHKMLNASSPGIAEKTDQDLPPFSADRLPRRNLQYIFPNLITNQESSY